MAAGRMLNIDFITSDAYLELPFSTQALYVQLNMNADDDGFLNNPRTIQRMVGATDDDLQTLKDRRYIIAFPSGVIVIKHWCIHNHIRKDRYKETVYLKEKAQLVLKDNGAYTMVENLGIPDDNQVVTKWLPNGIPREEERRKDKNNLVQNSIGAEENSKTDFSTGFSTEFSTREDVKNGVLSGKLGDGYVFITSILMDELLDKLSIDDFIHYVEVVAANEKSGKRYTKKTHFQAIMEMARKDGKL